MAQKVQVMLVCDRANAGHILHFERQRSGRLDVNRAGIGLDQRRKAGSRETLALAPFGPHIMALDKIRSTGSY